MGQKVTCFAIRSRATVAAKRVTYIRSSNRAWSTLNSQLLYHNYVSSMLHRNYTSSDIERVNIFPAVVIAR